MWWIRIFCSLLSVGGLRRIYSLVVEMLAPKLPELCARFVALPTEQYSACPAVLAHLSMLAVRSHPAIRSRFYVLFDDGDFMVRVVA